MLSGGERQALLDARDVNVRGSSKSLTRRRRTFASFSNCGSLCGTSQEESSDWALGGVHHGNSSALKTIGGSAGVTVKFDPGRQKV